MRVVQERQGGHERIVGKWPTFAAGAGSYGHDPTSPPPRLFALALPATASAASDGTSNTIMFAEFHHAPTRFMDYIDDV